jgi:trk system potassium uptake protein TrkA
MRLNNLNAEILEFVVKPESKVTGSVIRDLDFPKEATIGGVVRDGVGTIALGGFQIKAGDCVVVCCLPEAIARIERLFT